MSHRKSLSHFVLAAGLVAAAASPASAVILGRNARDGQSPPADSPWNYSGQSGGFLGTAVAPNFVLSAQHIGGSIGQTFKYNGCTYTTTAYYDDPASDLRLWRVDGDLGTYAPLHRELEAAGKDLFIVGRGTDRGEALATASGQTVGWAWGADRGVQRWGTNTATGFVTEGPGIGTLLTATFDGDDDATVSSGDSGGGFFIVDDDLWKLAGVAHSIDNRFEIEGEVFTGAIIGQTMYATSVAANIAWIDSVVGDVPTSVVPEPATVGLVSLAAATLTLRRRPRASR